MSRVLGIDLGTSKVAVVVLDSNSGELLSCETERSFAEVSGSKEGHFEQDPEKIFLSLEAALSRTPKALRASIQSIGITGQMHGVIPFRLEGYVTGNLITWQDRRCDEGGYLNTLHEKASNFDLCSGYGCASLAWLQDYQADYLRSFDRASTIHDFLAARLCKQDILTDPTNAMSWGLFDPVSRAWKLDSFSKLGLSDKYLPQIKPCGSEAGKLSKEYARQWELKPDIPVLLPIGDNQASLYSTVRDPENQLALTIGTGGQIAAVLSAEEAQALIPMKLELATRGTQIWPFVGEHYLAVGASLCGGQAFGWLTDSLLSWFDELDVKAPSRDEIFAMIDKLGNDSFPSPLSMNSSFLGERHDPTRRGSISEISLKNFSLGNITAALVEATISNLKSMLPESVLLRRKEIVGSGNGLRRLRLAQRATESIFGLPLTITEAQEEAARGAALLAARLLP